MFKWCWDFLITRSKGKRGVQLGKSNRWIERSLALLMLFFPLNKICAQDAEAYLNIMTFNIQMTDEYYELNKKQMVADILRNHNVDMIGIQEFQIQAVRELQELIPDFAWFGVGRDDGKVAGEMGPIFYKTDKFELLEQATFWLSEWPDVPGSKSWNTSSPRMVTWGRFRIKESNEIFYLFNTHFDHISVEARENSSAMLLERTSTIAGDKPVVITGDFNFSESSQAYKILIDDTPGQAKLFDSKYRSETPSFGPIGTYNGYSNENPSSKIDYIFVNPFVRIKSHGVLDDRPQGVWISDHYPIIVQVYFQYPQPPIAPKLSATAGDGMVLLSWDDKAWKTTREPFNGGVNDFEGYKLYRSTRIDFSDAVSNGLWDIPYMRRPIFICDLIDGIKGFTYYGIEEGLGYYLGTDTGIQHFYVDSTVKNGVTYFYMIAAFDFGIPQMGRGFAPKENDYFYQTDEQGKIIYLSDNVVVVTPHAASADYVSPKAEILNKTTLGSAQVAIEITDPSKIKTGHTYKIKFLVDSVSHLRATPQLRHKNDLLYTNYGFVVYDQSRGDSVVYMETPQSYSHKNIQADVHVIAGNIFREYWYLHHPEVRTDLFDGIGIRISNLPRAFAIFDSTRSGWVVGNAEIGITVNPDESVYFPWQYDIVFHDQNFVYTSKTNQKKFIRSASSEPLVSTSLLLGQSFNFEVINKSFTDESNNYEQLDLIVHDVNRNGLFDPDSDYVLAGHVVEYNNQYYWAGTVFGIDFHSIESSSELPAPNDVYHLDFTRPFIDSDSLLLTVSQPSQEGRLDGTDELAAVTIVPNPYVVANEMEYSGDTFPKKLMFNHLPAQCIITIFTISGTRVCRIDVNNPLDNGAVFWDLKSSYGQDVAPGYYIYHIKSKKTGAEKTAKFAVLR